MFEWLTRPRVKHPTSPTLYHFHPGPNWQQPGADGMVFEPQNTTPFILVKANGYVAGAMSILNPQIYNPVTVGKNGVPILAGQYYGQPLSEPNAG